MTGPLLEGVVVLDLTRLQPGNYATMLLADLGADVIKIEEPGAGDYVRWVPPMVNGQSAIHALMNRSKRSVVLNLKGSGGAAALVKLAGRSDVLIESFRPGVMDRLGVGYSRLSEINPRLVYAAITGFGQDGPYRDRAGHDINYIALAGALGSTGPAGGAPVLPSVQLADIGGALLCLTGVLAALFRRESSGRGEYIDVGMMDAALSVMALHIAQWAGGAGPLHRGSGYLNGGLACYRVYRCADDEYLSVGALEDRFWRELCSAVGRDDLAADQYAAGARQAELHSEMENLFAERPLGDWLELFAGRDVCVAPVNSFPQASEDPQIRARTMLDPGAEVSSVLGVPIRFAEATASPPRPAPGLGEHTEEVLRWAGVADHEIEELLSE